MPLNDDFSNQPSDPSNPNRTPPGNPPNSGASASRPIGDLDGNVSYLLRLLGLADCRSDTSFALSTFAWSVSPEVFELFLSTLAEIRPLWDQIIVCCPARRYMSTFLDELCWFVKNRFCQMAPPEVVASFMGIGVALDFGVALANRLPG